MPESVSTKTPVYKQMVLIINILFFGFIGLMPVKSIAQSLERHQAIGVYLYNFTKHLHWENESSYTSFSIALLSNDPKLLNELKSLSNSVSIKDKKVELSAMNKVDETLLNYRIIVIDEAYKELYEEIFKLCENKPILLISYNYSSKSTVMINLFPTEGKNIHFEINKANIVNQGIRISDEIIILGGDFIDVAEIYRSSQKNLKSLEAKLINNQKLSDSLQVYILESEDKIAHQQKIIMRQARRMIEYKQLSDSIGQQLDFQKKLLSRQAKILKTKEDSIAEKNKELIRSKNTLQKQFVEIDRSKKILDEQLKNIEGLNKEINQKTAVLNKQNITINRQKQINYLFAALIFFIFLVSLLLLRAYRIKQVHNSRLKYQKEEIETINEELKASNEELEATLEKLKDAQKKLVESEKMASLGVLTAGIAHELNNPINFVFAGVNSLRKDFEDILPVLNEVNLMTSENCREKIKEINDLKTRYYFEEANVAMKQTIEDIAIGASRVAEIVSGLRNFSREEKGILQKVNIHNILEEALIILKNKYKNKIEVHRCYKNDIPEISCYPGKLSQAFVNIISNGIDAIDKKGELYIETRITGDELMVSIKDTGKGMTEDELSKIFDPFFTTKQVGKGTGLGLSITYSVIKEHGGKIDVKSSPGSGTELMVSLPVKKQE